MQGDDKNQQTAASAHNQPAPVCEGVLKRVSPQFARILLVDHPGPRPAICGSGLGSSLFKLAAAQDARERGFLLDLLTTCEKVDLLRHSPTFENLFAHPEELDSRIYEKIVYLGVEPWLQTPGSFQASGPVSDKADYNGLPHLLYWRSFMGRHLGYDTPSSKAHFPYVVDDGYLSWARKMTGGRPLVCLSISALSHLKRFLDWGLVARQLLLERSPEIRLVLVGMEQPRGRFPPEVLDLSFRTSFDQLGALVSVASVVAGTDGLVTNLAMALARPVVALFTVIQPEFVIDSDQQKRSRVIPLVQTGCPLQPCYSRLTNYRTDACPLEPHLPSYRPPLCARFSPETVAAAILELFESEEATGLLAGG